jgi:hypothetical protein
MLFARFGPSIGDGVYFTLEMSCDEMSVGSDDGLTYASGGLVIEKEVVVRSPRLGARRLRSSVIYLQISGDESRSKFNAQIAAVRQSSGRTERCCAELFTRCLHNSVETSS